MFQFLQKIPLKSPTSITHLSSLQTDAPGLLPRTDPSTPPSPQTKIPHKPHPKEARKEESPQAPGPEQPGRRRVPWSANGQLRLSWDPPQTAGFFYSSNVVMVQSQVQSPLGRKIAGWRSGKSRRRQSPGRKRVDMLAKGTFTHDTCHMFVLNPLTKKSVCTTNSTETLQMAHLLMTFQVSRPCKRARGSYIKTKVPNHMNDYLDFHPRLKKNWRPRFRICAYTTNWKDILLQVASAHEPNKPNTCRSPSTRPQRGRK